MNRKQFENKAYRILLGNLAAEIANLSYILEGKFNILYINFQSSLKDTNNAFLTLWNSNQRTPALAFIRVVAEHLIYLYAEYLYPNRVMSGVYDKGKELDRIKANGEKIKPKDIRDKIEAYYKGFNAIWDRYHYYIHISVHKGHGELAGANETGFRDILKLNNWIIDVLTKIKGRYKRELKEKGLYQRYLDHLEAGRKEWDENAKEPD
ncbi:MAG: hypothetical protein HDS49_04830 [Bacteroides sp.]|nr:hypothetical protein [Bacteroides sp.]